MAINLPILHPDQTLYSWCAQVHALNDGRNVVETSTQLFGAPYAALCHDFPSHLDVLVARSPGAQFDASALALRHTLLGYFLPLQEMTKSNEIIAAVRTRGLPSIKMRLGITASRVGGHHPLKGCPKCIENDIAKFGHAYWHMAHQFPSVMACTQHRLPLFIAWDPVTPVHRRGWLLPVGGLPWQRIDIPMQGEHQLGQLVRLAEFSTQLAACCPGAFDPTRLARCYQMGLRGRGLATASGSLRLKSLIDETRRRYKGIEDIQGFEALQAVTPDWPGLVGAITRKSPRHAHPLKHLLVIALIFETWSEFIDAYETAGNDESIVDTGPSIPCKRSSAAELRVLVMREGLSVTAAAKKLGMSTTTATQIAKREAIPFRPRPKCLRGPLVRLARTHLQRGAAVKQVSETIGISVASLNRLLATDTMLNQAWQTSAFLVHRNQSRTAFLAVVERCGEASLKAVRKMPGNSYMWLYRHDRDWLRSQIPSLWMHHASGQRES